MTSNSTTSSQGYLEEHHTTSAIGTGAAFIGITVLTTALWTTAKRLQHHKRTWIDVLIPLSLIFNLATCTSLLLSVRYGAGRHKASLDEGQFTSFQQVTWYALPIMYYVACVFSRLAILHLYLRVLFDNLSRIVCYICGTIIIVNCILNIPVLIWQCHDPFSELWNPQPSGWCLNIYMHNTWSVFPNIITDAAMLILPIPVLVHLRTRGPKQIGIVGCFLLGIVGLGTSLACFVEFYKAGEQAMSSDPTWTSPSTTIWWVIEPGVYHLTACVLSYRPLIQRAGIDKAVTTFATRVKDTTSQQKDIPNDPEKSSASDANGSQSARSSLSSATYVPPAYPGRDSHPISSFSPLRKKGIRSADNLEPSHRRSDNNPMSSGYITVQREFHVRSGVPSESLDLLGVRGSLGADSAIRFSDPPGSPRFS